MMQSLQLPGGWKLPNAISSSIADVLKKHSAAIKDIVSAANPGTLARHFETAGLISSLDEPQATDPSVLDSLFQSTDLEKASIVIDEIQQNMNGTNVVDKFKKFCKILKENGNLATKGIVMMLEREVGLKQ